MNASASAGFVRNASITICFGYTRTLDGGCDGIAVIGVGEQ